MRRLLFRMLRSANSGDHPWKRQWFYPFKERLLDRYGIPDGYDLQVLPGKVCFRCSGDRHDPYLWDEDQNQPEPCDRCGGSGWWLPPKNVYLHRFKLWGGVFHTPRMQPPASPFHPLVEEPVMTFEGLLPRREVDQNEAARCALLLVLVFEPSTWVKMHWLAANNLWRRLRRRSDYLKRWLRAWREDDDSIPF